jgi:hypothetical protein
VAKVAAKAVNVTVMIVCGGEEDIILLPGVPSAPFLVDDEERHRHKIGFVHLDPAPWSRVYDGTETTSFCDILGDTLLLYQNVTVF